LSPVQIPNIELYFYMFWRYRLLLSPVQVPNIELYIYMFWRYRLPLSPVQVPNIELYINMFWRKHYSNMKTLNNTTLSLTVTV
jgi:hypothetical protein